MKKLLFIIIASMLTAGGFADEMPKEVKRLKSLRDKKVAKAIKDIDAGYFRELNKLKKKYASQGNYIAAAYIETMQVASIDEREKKTKKDQLPETIVNETFDDPDKSLWSKSSGIQFKDSEALAIKNSQKLQLNKNIRGDFHVEMKVQFEGDHRYGEWDFYIHLTKPNVLGLVRFDKNGSDSILICEGKTSQAYPGCERQQRNSRGLKGTLILERHGSQIQLSFINDKGGEIHDKVTIENFEETSVIFGLAGHPSTPRGVDEIIIRRLN